MFIARSFWSASRPLVSGALSSLGWAFIKTLRYPVVAWDHEDPALIIWQDQMYSSRSKMGQWLGWADPRPRMWVWVRVELVGLGHWDHPPQVRSRASSPRPMPLESPLPHFWCRMGLSLQSVGVSSHTGGRVLAPLLYCPARGRVIYLGTGEGQGWLSTALRSQDSLFVWPLW